MFSIFKRKSYLKDLIPQGYTDIHSHLLFGIDDGATSPEDTINLVRQLSAFGFGEFIATPHTMQHVWENTSSSIQNKLLETNELLKGHGLTDQLRAASEYLIDNNFAERFKAESLLTLKDNYVLVEMSYLNAPMQLMEILFDLQVAGYRPVLAHPERYIFYHQNYQHYKKLKEAGCLFQLNLLSATGYYGSGVSKVARQLLSDGMIDFAGSDVHHQKHVRAFESPVVFKDISPLIEAMNNNAIFSNTSS